MQAPFDLLDHIFMQLTATLSQPQKQRRVIQVAGQPVRQMRHHFIPASATSTVIDHAHPWRQRVGRWPVYQAKSELFIYRRLGRDAKAGQVCMAISWLAQWRQPIQRRRWIKLGKAFGRQTARIA